MMKINTLQIQKQILAPSLQQSIEVLMLPLFELKTSIEQELQANPLLEIDETAKDEEQDWLFDELRRQVEKHISHTESTMMHGQQEDEPEEQSAQLEKEETLEENLHKQLWMEVSDPLELKIGELIIGNINEDGFLTTTCEEIADLLQVNDLSKVDHVLRTIQSFDPIGVASRSLQECLLLQINEMIKSPSDLEVNIIKYYLPELGQKKYRLIAQKLNVPNKKVLQAAETIASLDPRPARNYRPLKANLFISPDVHVTQDENDEFQIYVNKEYIPPLRINPFYRRLLKETNLTRDEKLFIRERMKNALLFIKSIEQRGQTVKAITKFILEKQKDFFKNGHMSLAPLTLGDVAQAIGRNESTICRAISNKYINTPKGLFPMKFFFSKAINHYNQQANGSDISSRSIKEEIRDLVEDEDKTQPLSDQEIQAYFVQKGVTLARRTISKYRKSLKLLPSHLRKH